jgi:CubicO group peptidase (beta-lactamase class C family)
MKRHGEWVERTLVAAIVAGTGILAAAQGQAAAVDALVSKYAQLGQFNGTVLVAREGKVVLEKGYGMADFESSVPNRAETKQWIGSVTKVFTATMVMKLVDGGKLRLEDRVADLLPWYRKDTGGKVTVRELLNHTSGIPDYMHLQGIGREGFRKEAGDGVIDVKAFAQKWCSGDLVWEPGTKWGYSNSGYVLLGAIIEQVTGRTYGQALRELVLDPAGLEATGDLAMRPRAVVDGLASGYEKAGGTLVTRRAWNVSTAYAAGAMVSTVGDLYRFDRALDQPGFLSARAKEAMFTAGLGNWGCGWEVQTVPVGPGGAERKVVGHEGFIFWSLTRICRIPQDRIFIALINNTGDAPLQPLLGSITDVLYGRTPKDPVPSVGEALRKAIATGGPSAAAPRFRDLFANDPAGWDFGERAVNTLGYEYLQADHPDEAVAVFRLNVEVNPESGNAWDSLGEGLAAQGKREEAVKAYARALELDPANRNAVQMLQKITAD